MKLSIICILSVSFSVMLLGCSSQPSSKFVQLEKETSDYCSRFNDINESGEEITVTNYTIKTVETDSSGKKIETTKVVDCGV